jgi:uncharacterized membrane protein YbhN (UPF0104 family)
MSTRKKSYKFIVIGVKLIILAAAIFFVYYKVFYGKDTDILKEGIFNVLASTSASSTALNYLLIALLLMPINWGVEALKWRYLVKPITDVSVPRSIAATFSGATVSLFTPNRVGGFLGRIVYLDAEHRAKAAFVSIFGNFCQLLVTVLIGTIGLSFAVIHNLSLSDLTPDVLTSFMLVGIATSIVMLFIYFRPKTVVKFVFRFTFLQRFTKNVKVFKELEAKQLFTVLLFSLLRYGVFTFQFWLVLRAFGVPVDLQTGVLVIGIV